MPSYLTSDPSLTPDYNVPGEINPGITPGVWQTLRGPFQLPTYSDQAGAEFNARESSPRGGIPDDQMKQLTLERALEDQLSPFNVGLAMGAQAVAPYSTGRNYQYMGLGGGAGKENIRVIDGDIWVEDPATGNWTRKVDTAGKPVPDLTESQKTKLADLENQLKQEYEEYAKEPSSMRRGEHARTINGLKGQRDAILASVLKPSVPIIPQQQQWGIDPGSLPVGVGRINSPQSAAELNMFGQMGPRTPFSYFGENYAPGPPPFSFSGGAAPPPVAPAANPYRIIRRR